MVKSLTTLFVLLIASSVQGGGIFGTSFSVFESMLEDWKSLQKLVENTPITEQSCVGESWDLQKLSADTQMNSSVSCLKEWKAAVESENLNDQAILKIINKLKAIFTEGATCASTKEIWAYVKCYSATTEKAIEYMLTAWTTKTSASWELLLASSTIKSLAKSCVETIIETTAATAFESAVQEIVECVEKGTC